MFEAPAANEWETRAATSTMLHLQMRLRIWQRNVVCMVVRAVRGHRQGERCIADCVYVCVCVTMRPATIRPKNASTARRNDRFHGQLSQRIVGPIFKFGRTPCQCAKLSLYTGFQRWTRGRLTAGGGHASRQ